MAWVIKKRRYWPKYVPDGVIHNHIEDKSVVEVEVLNDKLYFQELNIFAMKNNNHVIMPVSYYDTLEGVLPK